MTDGREIPLSGGNITSIVRIDATVRREVGYWTPAVHQLLKHLEAVGFEGAPRVLGIDESAREILTYIEGEQGYYKVNGTRPKQLWSDEILVDAARLLRRFHDATSTFDASERLKWQQVHPDPMKHEVICHNDFGPYNCIFANGKLQAVIDFDTASPGPRIWDVAYAAYRFVPLATEDHQDLMGLQRPVQSGRRLRLFCDAYGLDNRNGFISILRQRIKAIGTTLKVGALLGNAAFGRLLAEGGHLERYERDLAFINLHARSLQEELGY